MFFEKVINGEYGLLIRDFSILKNWSKRMVKFRLVWEIW